MTNTPYKEQIEKIIRTSPSWNDKDPRTQSERIMEILDLAVAKREKEIVKIIIKSRTVNEQFGVGLNEETARNQILSDIMTTKELKQQAREEFDKQILNINIGTDWGICPSQIEAILHFLDSLIDRAVEMTEERIVGIVDKVELKVFDRQINNEVVEFYKDAVEETKRIIKSLITNNSDINK